MTTRDREEAAATASRPAVRRGLLVAVAFLSVLAIAMVMERFIPALTGDRIRGFGSHWGVIFGSMFGVGVGVILGRISTWRRIAREGREANHTSETAHDTHSNSADFSVRPVGVLG